MNISKTNTFFFKPFSFSIIDQPALPSDECDEREGACDYCHRRFRVHFSLKTETHVGSFHCESCGNKTPYVGIPGTASELLASENADLRQRLEQSIKYATASREAYDRAMELLAKTPAVPTGE